MIQKFTIYLDFFCAENFFPSYFVLLKILHKPFEMRNVVIWAPVFVSVCRWHTWNAYRWQNIWGIHAIWLENAFDDDDDDDGDIMHVVMKALSKLFSPSQCQMYLGSHGARVCVCARGNLVRDGVDSLGFFFSCMWFNWFISISSKLKRWKIIIFMCCTVCHQRLAFSSIRSRRDSFTQIKIPFYNFQIFLIHRTLQCPFGVRVCARARETRRWKVNSKCGRVHRARPRHQRWPYRWNNNSHTEHTDLLHKTWLIE